MAIGMAAAVARMVAAWLLMRPSSGAGAEQGIPRPDTGSLLILGRYYDTWRMLEYGDDAKLLHRVAFERPAETSIFGFCGVTAAKLHLVGCASRPPGSQPCLRLAGRDVGRRGLQSRRGHQDRAASLEWQNPFPPYLCAAAGPLPGSPSMPAVAGTSRSNGTPSSLAARSLADPAAGARAALRRARARRVRAPRGRARRRAGRCRTACAAAPAGRVCRRRGSGPRQAAGSRS